MSRFAHVPLAPPDPILGTAAAFKADKNPNKVNLGVGAYRTNEGKPLVLPTIAAVQKERANDPSADKEYLPIDGLADLKPLTQALLFGEKAGAVQDKRIASVQALSGTGSLRIAAEFIKRHLPNTPGVLISDPSWGNHNAIFKEAGLKVDTYPYWHAANKSLDFTGLCASLRSAAAGSVVLMHACAHNPTGVDPTEEQWKEMLEICRAKQHLPILDNAYQGYASGSLEKDGYAQRLFEESGLEFFVCQSFAKNMGLYGERVGMLHLVCNSAAVAKSALSQMEQIIRPMYSSPPLNGAHLVVQTLKDPKRAAAWKQELAEIAGRILSVRKGLRDGLVARGTPGQWDHITSQIGMFSYTGLSPAQCERLTNEFHIYLLKSGRISLAGLNDKNLDYVADAIDKVVRGAKL